MLESLILGIHLASVHIPAEDYQNNRNPGIYLTHSSGISLGTYKNTLRRQSIYFGYSFKLSESFDIRTGLISGYQKKIYADGSWRGNGESGIMPILALTWKSEELPFRIWMAPAPKKSSSTLHFSYEWSMK